MEAWICKTRKRPLFVLFGSNDMSEFNADAESKEVRRVEVKGTQGDGNSVVLTINEVNHAKSEQVPVDLFVVSHIDVVSDETGKYKAQNGRIRCHKRDWIPDDDDLDPTQFNYRVPKDSQV